MLLVFLTSSSWLTKKKKGECCLSIMEGETGSTGETKVLSPCGGRVYRQHRRPSGLPEILLAGIEGEIK
jgi:hypothetical protein